MYFLRPQNSSETKNLRESGKQTENAVRKAFFYIKNMGTGIINGKLSKCFRLWYKNSLAGLIYLVLLLHYLGKPCSPHWFVLSPKTLTCYEDIAETEELFTLKLRGLDIQYDAGNIFTLFYADGRNMYEDYDQLELKCLSDAQFHSWKDSLRRSIHHSKSVSYQIFH